MNKFLILLSFFLFGYSIQAQDEVHPCDENIDKKVAKNIEAANKAKDARKRYESLLAAYRLDEEGVKINYLLGKDAYSKSRMRMGANYKSAIKYFEAAYDACPDYSTDVLYYLGMSYMNEGELKSALSMFKEFLAFQSDYDVAYGRRYDKHKEEVEESIDYLEFEANFYTNKVPYEPKKIPGISTDGDEYLPMISPDNEIIFYTHHYVEKKLGIHDAEKRVEKFTWAKVPDGAIPGSFQTPKELTAPFNQGDNYGGTTVALDNQEMFITVCKPLNGNVNCDIYSSKWEGYKWSELKNLGSKINGEDSWESQPTLSADGNTLFFATAREGSKGIDIYESTRDANGEWTQAKPVDGINTVGDEKSPFLHSDSKTLYFSSKAPSGGSEEYKLYGAGGYDIFYSRYDEEKGEWQKPKNLGYPINTRNDEVGLMVATGGKVAYFSSNRIEGAQGWDVYQFDLYKEARPKRIVLVKGKLLDETGKADQEATIEIKNTKTNEVETVEVNRRDGSYAHVVSLEDEDEYVMTVKKPNAAFIARTIDADDTLNNSVAKKDLEVREIKVGTPYKIEDLYYATSSFDLNQKAKNVIKEFAAYLNDNPTIKIQISGHTDNLGNDAVNLKLSQDRADSVKDFLIELGVNEDRLKSKGYGETKPLTSNNTPEGRSKNRRTEFTIISK